MKIFKFLGFAAIIIILSSFIAREKIPVRILIENPENIEFKGGKLIVLKTKEEISITDLQSKEILVDAGKQQFKFISETPHYISYPKKIDTQNNTVKIRLIKSTNSPESGLATEKNFQELLKSKKLQFVHFGFASRVNPEFEKKYNVLVKNEGCVITPILSAHVTKNNQLIAEYLTKTFGDLWKKDLGFLPYGL
jgi:hypothetical protein